MRRRSPRPQHCLHHATLRPSAHTPATDACISTPEDPRSSHNRNHVIITHLISRSRSSFRCHRSRLGIDNREVGAARDHRVAAHALHTRRDAAICVQPQHREAATTTLHGGETGPSVHSCPNLIAAMEHTVGSIIPNVAVQYQPRTPHFSKSQKCCTAGNACSDLGTRKTSQHPNWYGS